MTPLRLAVRYGHGELAELLLGRGADASRVGAADRANAAVLAGRPVEAGDEIDAAPLERAVAIGDVDGVRRLLDAGLPIDGDPDGTPPLHDAAWRGHRQLVECLLRRGDYPGGGAGTHRSRSDRSRAGVGGSVPGRPARAARRRRRGKLGRRRRAIHAAVAPHRCCYPAGSGAAASQPPSTSSESTRRTASSVVIVDVSSTRSASDGAS